MARYERVLSFLRFEFAITILVKSGLESAVNFLESSFSFFIFKNCMLIQQPTRRQNQNIALPFLVDIFNFICLFHPETRLKVMDQTWHQADFSVLRDLVCVFNFLFIDST